MNSMEIELAKARLDLMKLDSQLMEAIQQKIQLSQQLEQWQVWMSSDCVNHQYWNIGWGIETISLKYKKEQQQLQPSTNLSW